VASRARSIRRTGKFRPSTDLDMIEQTFRDYEAFL
jgi:hypothetical protein